MIRIDLDDHGSFGPGKARLLELIDELASLRQAASAMEMSYRQAWLLIKAAESTFGAPLIETATGGARGGGSHLTKLGREVVARFRAIETEANRATRSDLNQLLKLLEPVSATVTPRRKLRPRTKS
jgi:molybdate transport system regulatory protein